MGGHVCPGPDALNNPWFSTGRGFISQGGGDAGPKLPKTARAKATTPPQPSRLLQRDTPNAAVSAVAMAKVKTGPLPGGLWPSLPSVPTLSPSLVPGPLWSMGSGTAAAPEWPHSTPREEEVWAAYAKSVSFKDPEGTASGTHNIIVCKDLLKISPPFFRAASLHVERTSKWKKEKDSSLGPGYLSWERWEQCIIKLSYLHPF